VTGFYSEVQLQRVLQAIDIVDLVGTYVALRPKGKEMVGLCPFHDDRRPSLNVNPGKQIFKCFSCGAGGDAIKFLMLRERLSFPEAVGVLAERAGVRLEEHREARGEGADRTGLEKLNRWAAQYFRSRFEDEREGERARRYVKERGLAEAVGRRFGLGWAPQAWEGMARAAQESGHRLTDLAAVGLVVSREGGGYYDRFRERLMFPVLDALGRVIGFGGRTLGDDPAKYLNSPESALFDKSRALYGIHAAKDEIVRQKTAVVVEGYTDCLMAHQFGVTNVVATLGTALTGEHAKALSRYADRIVLVFDADEAGRRAADRAVEVFFGRRVEVRLATVPEGKDPCDYLLARGREAFEGVVAGATEALEHKWQGLHERLEQEDTVHGRSRAVEEFLAFMAGACAAGDMDAISEGFALNQVAKLVGLGVEEVHRRVGQLRRRQGGAGRRGAAGAASGAAPAADVLVNAQREILEVLLNRPELFAEARVVIDSAEGFLDETQREIARRLWSHGQAGGTGPLAAILASCESPALCGVMTDLAARGEARGNFEDTLRGALGRVLGRRAERGRRELTEMIRTAAGQYGEVTEAALLQDVQARLRAAKVPPRA